MFLLPGAVVVATDLGAFFSRHTKSSFWTGGLRLHDFRPGPGPDSDGSKPQRAGTHCNERTLREQQIFSDSVTVSEAEPARPGRRGFPSTRDLTRFGPALRSPTGHLRNSGDRSPGSVPRLPPSRSHSRPGSHVHFGIVVTVPKLPKLRPETPSRNS